MEKGATPGVCRCGGREPRPMPAPEEVGRWRLPERASPRSRRRSPKRPNGRPKKRPSILNKQKMSKKKERKIPERAVAHITCTFNNTLITIGEEVGGVIVRGSAGTAGFKGNQKGKPLAGFPPAGG